MNLARTPARIAKKRTYVLLCALACLAPYFVRVSNAVEIVVDTDALTITSGGQAWDFGGAGSLVSASVNSKGIAVFTIGGDLNLSPSDTLTGVGSRPLSLLVGNDVSIASGSVIDFSAIDNVAGPGGGSVGVGGAGGIGGSGGEQAGGGMGGVGGFGSFGFGPIPLGAPPLVKATIGTAGFYTNNGEAGGDGLSGTPGGSGYGGTSGGHATGDLVSVYPEQTPMRPTEGGQTGLWPPIPSPVPGLQLILPDFLKSKGKDGLDGVDGAQGADGELGLRGNGGLNNAPSNSFSLTGGAGGSGGSGGSGGQGGQSGSGGAGGGGGQGDWVNQIGPPPLFPYWVGVGGEGGDGGQGGTGGHGGQGGDGGVGGAGGAGGGAFEINALGTITFDGLAMARGGNGATGGESTYLSSVQLGSSGESGQFTGIPGFSFSPLPKKLTDYFDIFSGPILKPSIGTGGGDGGSGGDGAIGGAAGDGGAGGGGAGGAIKLVGSIVAGAGSVDASGGMSGDGVAQAGDGRFLVGANNVPEGSTATSVLSGTSTSVQSSTTRGGNVSLNPYVTTAPLVPNLGGLVGGAEAFGYTSLAADTTHVSGDTLLQNSPAAAVVGAIRLDSGPDEYMHGFEDHDMVLVFNARTDELTNVRFGMNIQDLDAMGNPLPNAETSELAPYYVLDLLEGGWQNDPRFGGLGDVLNGTLQGYEVYATLIPEDTLNQGLNFSVVAENAGNTFVASIDKFVNGQALFAEFNPDVPVLTSTWVGPTGLGGAGTWNTATHWSTVDADGLPVVAVVPNNSTGQAFNVVIDSGVAEVEQDTLITIDSLTIGAADQLKVLDTQRLILERFSVRPASGMIENNGLILLDGATSETALRLSGTGVKFAGTGMLTSTDSQFNKVSGIRTTDGFTQYPGHTIEMVGVLGDNTLQMTNQGAIRAKPSAMGNSLVIDPSGDSTRASASFVNEGSLVADGAGAKLVLVDGHFQNKNGATIGAYNGGEIELQNVMFSVDVGSTLEVLSGSTLSINGDLELPEGAVIQGDADTTMNFADGAFKNRGRVLNPGGVATFHNVEIDNTDGVIEAHTPNIGDNVSGSFALRNGVARGQLRGAAMSELALTDVRFEDSSTTSSEAHFDVSGDAYLSGRIDAPYIEILATDSIFLDDKTTFTGDAYIEFGYFDAYAGLEFSSPGGYVELSGSMLDTVDLDTNADTYIYVEEWYLNGVFTNRGYTTLDFTSVFSGEIDNAGQVIELYDTYFEDVTVIGGELEAYGAHSSYDTTYKDVVLGGDADYDFQGYTVLDNVTNAGGTIYADEVELRTRFTNNGAYEAAGDIYLDENLTIDGFGDIYLYGGISGNQSGITLNLENQYIEAYSQGGESIGGDILTIVSTSEIYGDFDPTGVLIDPVGDADSMTPGFLNRGSVYSVTLTDGYFDNTGGRLDGVILDGVRVVGGTLESSSNSVEVYGGVVLEDIVVNGFVSVDGDLEFRGVISSDTSASFSFSGGNLYINQDTTFASIELDVDTDFSGSSILGDPAATLTIDSGSILRVGFLELGANTPTLRVEGELYTDYIDGVDIVQTVPAGSTYSEIAYALYTGADPTGIDPGATIVLAEDLVFSGLPTLRNPGYLSSDSGFLDVSNVILENQGTIDAELMLYYSVINNAGDALSVSSMEDSRIIGGSIDDTWASRLEVYGDSYVTDTDLYLPVEVDGSTLTLLGTTPEAGSGLPASQVNLGLGLTGYSADINLVGNVENQDFISTHDSYLNVVANLEAGGDPEAFIGFVNEGDFEMTGGEVYFEGLVTNNNVMTFYGTSLSFGPGLFRQYADFMSDEGIDLYDPESNFMVDPFSYTDVPYINVDGGTLIAESAWIDGEFPGLTWNTGGVRLTDAAGHTVGQGTTIDILLGGGASVLNASRNFSVDQSLTVPAGTAFELAGGRLRAGAIEVDGGTFTFNSGELSFDTMNESLTNVAGTLAPGESAGTAVIDGDYSQLSAGALEIELVGLTPGDEFDVLGVNGIATLGGTLRVLLINEYSPALGDSYEIVTATGGFASTTFDTLDLAPLSEGLAWNLVYSVDSILIEVLLGGDLNRDGSVDAADYTVWRDNEGITGGLPFGPGDANGDGAVDSLDYALWVEQFGMTTQTAAIPEPSVLLLTVTLCVCYGSSRCRQHSR